MSQIPQQVFEEQHAAVDAAFEAMQTAEALYQAAHRVARALQAQYDDARAEHLAAQEDRRLAFAAYEVTA